MAEFKEILGKKIIAFRGRPLPPDTIGIEKIKRETPLEYVLLDDGETYLQFEEQSYYDYHDCCYSARTIIDVHKNKDNWQKMIDCDGYQEPDNVTTRFEEEING